MARHPPLRNRVRQLSSVPVALWRRLVAGVAFVLAWLAVWLSGATVATAVACGLLLWVWSGSDDSLRQTLAIVQPWVPALQTLELEDDTDASVRNGGTLGQVRWHNGQGLSLTATDATLTWDLLPLLRAQPLAMTLRAAHIEVTDHSPAAPPPHSPPATLVLPVAVQVQLDIDRLTLAAEQPVHIDHIRGDYRYDGDDEEARHQLSQLHLQLAQGRYDVEASLQALPPMRLSANIQGSLSGQLPSLGNQPAPAWQGRLKAQVHGTLSDADPALATQAQLDLSATLDDESPGTHRLRPGLQANASVRPWQAPYLHALQADIQHLNLAAFWPQLPNTVLSGQIHAQPATGTAPDHWRITAALTNSANGPWDSGQLPLSALQLQASASAQALDITQLQARVGQGTLQGQGNWQVGQASAQAKLTLTALPLHALHTLLQPALLSGSVQVSPGTGTPSSPPSAASAKATPTPTHIAIDLGSQPIGPLANAPTADADPRPPRHLDIASLKAQGQWTGQQLQLSQLWLRMAGADLRGQGNLTPSPLGVSGQWQLQAPGLQAHTSGQLSADQGAGQLSLQATDAARLLPWLRSLPGVADALPPGLKLTGDAQLVGQWQGGWAAPLGPHLQARLSSGQLSVQPTPSQAPVRAQATQLTLDGHLGGAQLGLASRLSQGDWNAQLNAQTHTSALTSRSGQLSLDTLNLRLHHTQATQALLLHSQQAIGLQWAAGNWQLSPGQLTVQAQAQPSPASTTAPTTASTASTAASTRISWQQTSVSQGWLTTEGQIHDLGLDWLDAIASLTSASPDHWLSDQGLQTDLLLAGRWQVRWPLASPAIAANQPPTLQLALQRQRGDLRFSHPEAADTPPAGSPHHGGVAAGIEHMQLLASTQGANLLTSIQWRSQLTGQLAASFQTPWQLTDGRWALTPQSPLQGSVSAHLPDMSLWSPLVAPPGWRAHGRLKLEASAGGTLGQPDWRGELAATDLAVRSVIEGLEFGNGRLVAKLSGEQIHITQLELDGAGGAKTGGHLSGTGLAQWSTGSNALPQRLRLTMQAKAERLRVSSRADRRLTLSGDVSASLQDQLLKLRGELAVDQALFILPDETTPALGSDVVVRQTTSTAPVRGSRVKTDLLIHIALGKQLEVRGQGLQTHLGGQVSLISSPSSPGLRVLGEVRTLDGSYKAYGQRLKMEEGVIRFSGPYDDPTLNILALRPASAFRDSDAQVVGVKITGSARAPLVKLYANPDLPDSEKLAWLVLGRPASGTGAEAAILQQAALALLSGSGGAIDASLASRLGLDEIAFRGSSTQADGTTQAAGVALGKRLSNKLYVAYETSLNTAMGTVSLFYDVSRRLTLRARAGEENAIDLIFTIPHD